MITAPGNVTSVAGRQGAVVLTKADVGLSNVDNTSDANKPLSSAMTTALAGKEAAFAAGTTSQYRRGDKTWQTLDKTAVGLANVDNTADSAKPLSTAMTTALAGKEASLPAGGLTTHYLRGDKTWVTHDKASVGLANVDNTADSAKPVSTAQATAIAAKENTITAGTTAQYYRGDKTWQTLNAAAVGLAIVNNTADSAKPVSTAQQTALDLKANLASPTFTGTPTLPAGTLGLTKSTVGLANVDNTADTAKPVSTAQQTALNGKANVTHTHTSVDILSIDGGTP
jgi:hypothetical protein